MTANPSEIVHHQMPDGNHATGCGGYSPGLQLKNYTSLQKSTSLYKPQRDITCKYLLVWKALTELAEQNRTFDGLLTAVKKTQVQNNSQFVKTY